LLPVPDRLQTCPTGRLSLAVCLAEKTRPQLGGTPAQTRLTPRPGMPIIPGGKKRGAAGRENGALWRTGINIFRFPAVGGDLLTISPGRAAPIWSASPGPGCDRWDRSFWTAAGKLPARIAMPGRWGTWLPEGLEWGRAIRPRICPTTPRSSFTAMPSKTATRNSGEPYDWEFRPSATFRPWDD
jgi:hypothetical protein